MAWIPFSMAVWIFIFFVLFPAFRDVRRMFAERKAAYYAKYPDQFLIRAFRTVDACDAF